jgi:hypothetical protein
MSDPKNPSIRKTDSLLHTKLMPPRPHAAVIPRSDLLARLDAALGSKLILVSAPTGYGKTTLVSMWLAGRDFASAWVNLDGNDNDPTRFWTYFVAALRTFDGASGKTTLSALAAPQPAPFQTLLPPLMNELASLKEPCVLVLDEWQAIVSPAIQHNPGLYDPEFTRTAPPGADLTQRAGSAAGDFARPRRDGGVYQHRFAVQPGRNTGFPGSNTAHLDPCSPCGAAAGAYRRLAGRSAAGSAGAAE